MLAQATPYEQLYQDFKWSVPERFNIAEACCDRWADDPDRIALIEINEAGESRALSFRELQIDANRLANSLQAQGIEKGDRVGIFLPQCAETAFAHLACYKLGAIAVPMFSLFGPDALRHRMRDCSMRAVISDQRGIERIAAIRAELDALKVLYTIDKDTSGLDALAVHEELARHDESFETLDSLATDPALIIYTSGTTGSPKGATHAHHVLIGHLPGVQMSHDLFPQPGDLFWTPADWAWIGGLLDVLLPSLYFGVPVVARRMLKFDPEAAFALLERHQVRNVFLPPTALKLMRQVDTPEQRWDFDVRSIASGGESLGKELLDWGRRTFGVTINEFYGQTECNMVLSSCATLGVHRPGVIGKPVPGHTMAVIDAEGMPLPNGEVGNIAVRAPDPTMFLGYWNNPTATDAKFIDDWLLTGDMGTCDTEGYFTFMGRNDDVITSAGYRIGPAPIEDCLLRHPAIRMAAVVGKKDPLRTEIVKAYVVLVDNVEPSDTLAAELQAHVKSTLSAHEYPREIAFVDEFPMTLTGKIIRHALKKQDDDPDVPL